MGAPAYSNAHDTSLILYLALVTGLVALTLYYYGLQRTPAVLSSLAELTRINGGGRGRGHLRVQPAPGLDTVDRRRT